MEGDTGEGKIIRGQHYISEWGIRNRNSRSVFLWKRGRIPGRILGVGNSDARKTSQDLALEENIYLAVLWEKKMKHSTGNRLLNIALLSKGNNPACPPPLVICFSFLYHSLTLKRAVVLRVLGVREGR